MAILRLQHIGTAVHSHDDTCATLERMGLPTRDFRNDQGKGFQYDSRALLGNECWLHIVQNWNPEARVNRFLSEHGEGLEHLALQSDDIEADVKRVRELGVPLYEDKIFDANDGFEAFVYPNDAIGFTVELIQPHPTSWVYPVREDGKPVSDRLGMTRAVEVGAIVDDVDRAADRFRRLFGVQASGNRIQLGNVELVLATGAEGQGLNYVALETEGELAGPFEGLGFRITRSSRS